MTIPEERITRACSTAGCPGEVELLSGDLAAYKVCPECLDRAQHPDRYADD